MIRCNLDQLLANLPDEAKDSLRGHARAAGIDWAAFSRLRHNRLSAVELKTLRQLRAYLNLPAGETRFHLAELMKERGMIRDELAEGTGKANFSTFSRMTNNTVQRANFKVMEGLCEFLKLDSLEQLLDTGGLLVWEKDGEAQ
jgi:DNA-binding Xre family transcriptional regulator